MVFSLVNLYIAARVDLGAVRQYDKYIINMSNYIVQPITMQNHAVFFLFFHPERSERA